MWFSQLRRFFLHLWHHKLYSLITIFGFAVSLMFVILIGTYVRHQLSVDGFHEHKSRIYRFVNENDGHCPPPMGKRLMDMLPEVETFTRLKDEQGVVKIAGGQQFTLDFLAVDSAFFRMFSFPLLEGSPGEVLKGRHSIILSKTYARSLFGEKSPIGEQITLNKNLAFTVTGVMEDMPENTHIKSSNAIINFNALADIWGWEGGEDEYGFCSFGLYFLARDNANLPAKAALVEEDLRKDFWIFKEGRAKKAIFEPLEETYFSQTGSPAKKTGSKSQVLILSGIVILILLLAVANYINMTLARAGFRGKEIAVKKLVGSSRKRLFFQLIAESVAIILLAFVLTVLLSLLAEPFVNNLLGIRLSLLQDFSGMTFISLTGILLLTGFISGLVPAIAITNFKAIEVVKGSFRRKSKQVYGKGLIAFQYCIAIVLLIGTWMIVRQTQFLREYPLGFDQQNILWLTSRIDAKEKEAFREILKNIPGVENVAYVAGSPLDGGNNQSYVHEGKPVSFQTFTVDSTFFSMLNIPFTPTGAALSKEAVWLNKKAVKVLELEELPVSLKWYEEEFPVYGIVEDFHFKSLYETIGPAAILQMTPEDYPWQILVKVSGANIQETVSRIEEAYKDFTGGQPMEHGFMDDSISEWYQQEENTAKIIGFFTILAIIISALGVLAMATYYIRQRQKEIGVRKVNGSESWQILIMLNKDFLKWVLLAFIIACPVAWYAVDTWLQNFPYRTEIPWWIFALSGIFAMAVALLTISWQSWRAATRNPVESLRYE